MGLRRTIVVLLALTLALVAMAATLSACDDDSATDEIYETATGAIYETATGAIYAEGTTSTSERVTTTEAPRGASVVFVKIGEAAKVEQGELTVDKLTVTDDLASDEANALLLTGEKGEGKNVSKKPAEGNEFLMVTFKYKKAAHYDFRGGLYSDDILLKDGDGKEYEMVETKGYGGIAESNAADVKPDVEAFTTAVYEVPKGKTGLVLVYHHKGPDGFTCNLR